MSKIKEVLKQSLSLDKKAVKDGKWVYLRGTDIEFLTRPATVHNKDFQAKLIKSGMDVFNKIKKDPEKMKDEKVQKQLADLLIGTIIIDVRKEGVTKEELGELEADDLVYFMSEFEEDFSGVLYYAKNRNNYRLIEEQDEKN